MNPSHLGDPPDPEFGGDLLTSEESHFLISFSFFARRFFFLWRGLDSKIISSSSKVGSQFSLPFCKEDRQAHSLDSGIILKIHQAEGGETHLVLPEQPKHKKLRLPLYVGDNVLPTRFFIFFHFTFCLLF